jgi:lambda family phage tail tape measure protein
MSAPSGAPSPWDNPTVTLPKRPGQTSGPMRTVTPGVDKEAAAARRQAEADARRLAREAEAAAKRQADLEKKGFEVAVQQREEAQRAIAQENDAYTRGEASMRDKQRMQETQMERDQEMFMLELRGADLKKEDLQLSIEMLKLANKHKDAIEEINSDKTLDVDARNNAIAKENDLNDKAVKLALQRNKAIKDNQDAQKTFSYGWSKAFEDYKDNALNAASQAAQTFQLFSKTMEDAIDNFVFAGGKSFKDFADNVIKQLIAIQLKKQALQIFDQGSAAAGNILSASIKFLGFADGGEPPVNQASMVGERGPELFVPKTAGTIIPNNMLNASSNAPTINYNGPYIANMSAIDTQSGAQFLAKNKQAVWATYQSANRSIPMSR